MNKHVEGRLRGLRITRQPLREVMPAADTNVWLWFAWDAAGDVIVAGARTLRDLERELEDPPAEAQA